MGTETICRCRTGICMTSEIAPKTTPSGFAIDHTKQCAQSVAHSWVLQVEGESKPGNAAYASLMIAAHDKAIRINHIDRDMASTTANAT